MLELMTQNTDVIGNIIDVVGDLINTGNIVRSYTLNSDDRNKDIDLSIRIDKEHKVFSLDFKYRSYPN